ncbi:MAG TPA: WD40 repeat domain-containing protein, partial [Gemmataceae bacterium]|nr:WD40 repeat domain-containing protein [Gemmataceae bacterium]
SGGYQVQLWNLESKKQVGTLSLGIDWLAHVSFSRDEDTVALTTTNQGKGRVMVWDLKGLESKEIWSLETRIDRQFFHPVVVLSPDAKRVVACHLDLVLRCWDVDTSKLVWESKKKLNSPFIFFSPDGKQLISTSGIGTPEIDIRDAATGDFITEKMKSPEEACYPLGFSPDGKLMVFQTGQEGLVLWEPTAAKVAFTLPAPLRRRDSKTPFNPNWMPHNWAFTPDGKSLIRRCDALQRWNLATGKAVYSDSEDSGHAEDITAVIFSPDGKFVATSASDQTCRLWDLASSRSVHAFPIAGSAHLAFTSDSHQVLALALHLGKIVLGAWDVVTGKKINGFCLADDSEFMSAFTDRQLRVTADGKKVLMLTFKNGRRDEESMLTVWNAAMRECLVHKRVPWNEDSIITPDGDAALAVDPVAGTVRLMDIKTEKPRWSLAPPDRMLKRQGQHYRNWFLAVSPRGRFMASCFHFKNDQAEPNNVEENVIYVGDLATGRERMKLLSSDETIVTFSNDERTLAVAGDQGIRLFETASGHEVGTIKLPPTLYTIPGKGWIRALAFSPDGRTLATGQADATILLWDATLRAGARGGRLTEAQSQSLWTDLSGDDAVRAFTAIWRFVDDPKQAVALLQNRLEPVRSPAAEKVQALVNELDSAEFNVRETAQKQLAEFGQLIAPALREALKSDPSAEKKRRMESIMANLDPNGMVSGPHLREIRAMQILEKIGSAEARELLKKVAQGDESARLTTEAKKALERIER